MTCSELGLSEYALRVSKSADSETIGSAPASTDLTGYTAEFVVRATESAATALLTVTETPTANASVVVIADNLITLRLKKLDLQTLPAASDPDAPWEGWCELTVTAPTGLESRVWLLPIVVEKGVVR